MLLWVTLKMKKFNTENIEALNTLILCAAKYQKIEKILNTNLGYVAHYAYIQQIREVINGSN